MNNNRYIKEDNFSNRNYEEDDYEEYENNGSDESIFIRIIKAIILIITFPFRLLLKFFDIIANSLKLAHTGCSTISFIITLFIISIILILAFKPEFIWSPLKEYLNNSIEVDNINDNNLNAIYEKINNNKGNIELNNSEITLLIRNYSSLNNNIYVKSIDNGISYYINIDKEDKPLWIKLESKIIDDKLIIDKIGFGRFDIPKFFANLLNDTVVSVFDFIEKQIKSNSNNIFIYNIFESDKLNEGILIKDIVLKDNLVEIYFQDNISNND